jgi:ABC-type glycerol-3-phosphate transport system substrate-binding protein
MSGETRTFQIVLIGIFVFLAFAGIAAFALFRGFGQEENPYGNRVVIWGTLDDAPFIKAFETLSQDDAHFQVVSYVEKDPRTFERDLVNALAEGAGPDLVILSHDMLIGQRGKIWPITYEQYPVRTFRDTYIDGAEIFLLDDGIYALPIAVDPLVMYWNRDIFASNGLSQPPKTWEELVAITVPTLVQRSATSDILRAAVAFGEYANVRNAKEMLLALFLQAGSNMIVPRGDRLSVELNVGAGQGLAPAEAALRFYSEFSNPTKSVYSWNRALPSDRSEFLAGDLALYFGFASEHQEITDGNPNLSFDVAELPQSSDARLKKSYGTFYGVSLMRASQNPEGAFRAMYVLSAQAQTDAYAEELALGPVHRASYGGTPRDPFLAAVERASLIARGWLDPDPAASENIFKQLIEDIASGRAIVSEALSDAEERLRLLVE